MLHNVFISLAFYSQNASVLCRHCDDKKMPPSNPTLLLPESLPYPEPLSFWRNDSKHTCPSTPASVAFGTGQTPGSQEISKEHIPLAFPIGDHRLGPGDLNRALERSHDYSQPLCDEVQLCFHCTI